MTRPPGAAAIYRSEIGRRAVEERYRRFLGRWPVPAEHVRVPTSRGETFVVVSGPPGAPPLVLLHGSTTNSAMWLPDVAAFSHHFRVHAVDLIGEPGLSDPSRPPLDTDATARWLQDVLDGLQITRPAIAAVSLGAWTALDYATRNPADVDRLALLAPGGIGPQHWARPALAALLMPFGPAGRRKALHLLLGTAPGGSPSAARPQSEHRTEDGVGKPEAEHHAGDGVGTPGAEHSVGDRAGEPETDDFGAFMLLISRTFRSRRDRLPIFADEALRRLKMPMLVVVGGRDAFLDSRATQRRLAHAVPHATVDLLPEAGHHLPGQTDRVLDFLMETPHA